MTHTILVVDDEPLKRLALQVELQDHGFEVLDAAEASDARRHLNGRPVSAIVAEDRLPGLPGLDLITLAQRVQPHAPVILMTAGPAVDRAVRAIKRGAYDYITKPFTTLDLLERLNQALAQVDPRALSKDAEEIATFGDALCRSRPMRRLFEHLRRAAQLKQPVLLSGELGTGKTLLARAVHRAGPRAQSPLITYAARISTDRGTAALGDVLRDAAHGSVLIEDIDHLTQEQQVWLAEYLDQHHPDRTASGDPAPRVFATTQIDLRHAVREATFDERLFHHLDALSVLIPPLRERLEDIPLLAQQAVKRLANDAGPAALKIEASALEELTRHTWPGNVRELDRVIERAAATSEDASITATDVLRTPREPISTPAALADEAAEDLRLGLNEAVADVERRLILMALRQCNGNQARAARRLRIPRTTLRDKISKYNLPPG